VHRLLCILLRAYLEYGDTYRPNSTVSARNIAAVPEHDDLPCLAEDDGNSVG
jgi:hypothetical protein